MSAQRFGREMDSVGIGKGILLYFHREMRVECSILESCLGEWRLQGGHYFCAWGAIPTGFVL